MKAALTLLAMLLVGAAGFGLAWTLRGAAAPSTDATAGTGAGREVLYWVAPMDPAYRRDRPGKSPMGMDLVPVYGDATAAGADAGSEPALRIDAAIINNIGVKLAPVTRTTLARPIRTVGYVVPDADRIAHIHVRSEGWIERLEAATRGDRVARGDLLFEIYSPMLVSAQNEYLQTLGLGRTALVNAAGERLRALGMSAGQVRTLAEKGSARQRFDVRAPQDGYVMDLNVREGMFVEPGTTIMSLADLSEVWVDVDVFEQQIDWVRPGLPARMRLPFAPARVWLGEVDYVYPTIRAESRTARLRLAFDNPDLALKPAMYAKVEITVDARENVLSVPREAVIRTGEQERVILALGEGRFRPAQVVTGLESDGRVEILQGLAEGEQVVVSAQFLIDSEASMDASLLRLASEAPRPLAPTGTPAPAEATPGEATPVEATSAEATPGHAHD